MGLDCDVSPPELTARIYEVETGWWSFLRGATNADAGKEDDPGGKLFTKEEISSMEATAKLTFRLDTLTEDNLPAYVDVVFSSLREYASRMGVEIPALEEWGRGIWPAEENAHKMAMNFYGRDTGLTTSLEHAAGVNSQLRAGMEQAFEHVIRLFAYVSWQEMSTNYAHKRNGHNFGLLGYRLQAKTAGDEARHHDVYQSVLGALFDAAPGLTISILKELFEEPHMPGRAGIPDYRKKTTAIAKAAIFDKYQGMKAAKVVLNKLGIFDADKMEDLRGRLGSKELAELDWLIDEYGDIGIQKFNTRAKYVLGRTATAEQLARLRTAYRKSHGLPVYSEVA